MDDALSQPALMIGSTAFVVMGSLFVFALLALPAARGLGMVIAALRWLMRARPSARVAARGLGLEPPLELAGLSAPLADLARHTRLLALELRRWDREADRWPDASEADATRHRWLDAFVGRGGFEADTAATRAVFEWLRDVEALPEREREQLVAFGIEVEALRALVTAEGAAADRVRALAGAAWAIDQRLLDAGRQDYRGSAGVRVGPLGSQPDDEREAELQARRRRWVAVLGEHGPGLSRLAARHAHTPAEREDLEQDIALALWQALPRWRSESSLKTFAYAVARYCCFGALRRRPLDEPLGDAAAELGDPDPCSGSSVERWLGKLDELARLEQARAALPATLGSTLALRLEGKSYAEIADALGISEQNVSVRLTRARKQLEQRLAAIG